MVCPYCMHTKTSVVDTRPARESVRRNRRCLSCRARFTTQEVYTMSRTGERLTLHSITQRLAKQRVIEMLEGMIAHVKGPRDEHSDRDRDDRDTEA